MTDFPVYVGQVVIAYVWRIFLTARPTGEYHIFTNVEHNSLDPYDRWLLSRWKITQMFFYCQVQIGGKILKRWHRGKKLCTIPGVIALYDFGLE